MFANQIDPLLSEPRPKGSCIGCHQGADATNGPDFLGPTTQSHYNAIIQDPTVVGPTPQQSLLYSRGDHTGNAFCTGVDTPYNGCTADEASVVASWITLQASVQ